MITVSELKKILDRYVMLGQGNQEVMIWDETRECHIPIRVVFVEGIVRGPGKEKEYREVVTLCNE